MRDACPRAGGPSSGPSDLHLWQIHWAASPQRIEECVLSGKDGNVSAVGPQVGWGKVTAGAGDSRKALGPGRHLGTSLAFPLAPG